MCVPVALQKRDWLFDNAKGALILFVVAVHASLMWPCTYTPLQAAISILITVVMPGFCFVSGHLSSVHLTRTRAIRLFQSLIVLLLWQSLFIVVKISTSQEVEHLASTHNLTAHWPELPPKLASRIEAEAARPWIPFAIVSANNPTWFLLCLVVWRALLPAMAMLRRPMLLTVVLALAVPFTDVADAGQLGTVFGYFPFFMAGHCLPRPLLFDLINRRLVQLATVLLLLAWITTAALLPNLLKLSQGLLAPVLCFYGWGHFEDTPHPPPKDICRDWRIVLGGLAAYPLCCCMLIGFLSLMPRRKLYLLTVPGVMSMYIYLLHPLISLANSLAVLGVSLLLPRVGGCESGASAALYVSAVLAVWAALSTPLSRLACRLCVEVPCVEHICCRPVSRGAEFVGGGYIEPLSIQQQGASALLVPSALDTVRVDASESSQG